MQHSRLLERMAAITCIWLVCRREPRPMRVNREEQGRSWDGDLPPQKICETEFRCNWTDRDWFSRFKTDGGAVSVAIVALGYLESTCASKKNIRQMVSSLREDAHMEGLGGRKEHLGGLPENLNPGYSPQDLSLAP
ncbi:hypothetical protein R3P38DRAFT_2797303 [Favolaschia claudopus]|uniref:Uncharacterized protein n=1 Tax=Favolaschia claudopus TaxID=2862362 RepID=A0AAW0A4A0_9AGAR